ncbi:hypothetical protein DF209_18485 [Pectobacterium polaris]|nr:hypothetical protein DF209_18485 [Pectobacterium polaris]
MVRRNIRLRVYPIRAILFAILNLGSAQNPHVLRVRSGFSALSVSKLAEPITPTWTDSNFRGGLTECRCWKSNVSRNRSERCRK